MTQNSEKKLTPEEIMAEYFANLTHAHKSKIINIYNEVLSLNPELETNIKWNAPNFVKNGIDCITFRLFPKDVFEIILHRGAKKISTEGFEFKDESNLVKWATPDRGIIDFLSYSELNPLKLEILHKWHSQF